MVGDWIKLHRKMSDSIVMSDDWLCRLWMSCLLKANWKTGFFKGETINPGQFAFSYRLWCEALEVSKGKLKRGLKKLENSGMIRVKSGTLFSVVTICKWTTYQNDDDEGGTPMDTQTGRRRDANGTLMDPDRRREERKKGRRKEEEPPKSPKGGRIQIVGQEMIKERLATIEPDRAALIEEWISYKAERNERYKPMGFQKVVTRILNLVDEHGLATMQEAIDLAIANNHKGFYLPESVKAGL